MLEALSHFEWKEAIKKEMCALNKNNTWDIVDLPQGKIPVGCKWVFIIKLKPAGNVDKYKAHLVAKGYAQTYGVYYQETFAPVAKMNSIYVLLSLATHQNWHLLQFNVKNAFLHGALEEEVFMKLPPSF